MAEATVKLVKKLTICVNDDINRGYVAGFGGNGSTLDDTWEAAGITKQTFAIKFGDEVSFEASVTKDKTPLNEVYKATLKEVHYDKKVFAPGEVRLVFSASRDIENCSDKDTPSMTFSNLARNVFFGGTFLVDVFGVKPGCEARDVSDKSQTVGIASNYYIHSMDVENTSSNTSSVILRCYSFDKRLTTARFSSVYTGKKFASLCEYKIETLLESFKKDLMASSGKEVKICDFPEYELKAGSTTEYEWTGDNRLFMLAYDSSGDRASGNTTELIHPYLVQYNESLYDFMVRVAHRCGEFLYFENGEINLGLPSDVWEIISATAKAGIDTKTLAPLAVKPLCSYHDISSDDGIVTVTGFHRDYVTGVPVVTDSVSVGNYYYDIQNTSDEDLHYISEEDNDRDRKSPRATWLMFNFFSVIFINEKPLDGLGAALAYLMFDVTCMEGIIPSLTAQEFRSKYLADLNETVTKIPMVDEDGVETGEYAEMRKNGSETVYRRIKSDGVESEYTTDDESAANYRLCDSEWYMKELKKSKDANAYYDGQKCYDSKRISSNVGIAVGADYENSVDDTANLCNSFFHFIETEEEKSERKSVVMNFSSNLPDLYLGRLARLDDGIEDIYLVTRMYGSYVSNSNAVDVSNYAEGVPVLGEEFEGMKNTVVPARGDIPHSRQVSAMEAIVVKNEDPLRLGRVRVRYPWQSDGDVNISPWIRITVPFSGTPEFGGFTMTPEVGEHVMLSYVAGNIERPYVEGSLYFRERVKKGDKTEWLVNSPLVGGAEASKISYRQIARTDYYRTSYKVRSILSGNGHGLIMSDLSDCNFFTSTIPFCKALVTLGNTLAGKGALHDANVFGLGVIKGGGVTLTDGSYMCTVDLLPDKRAINITSSFGTVSIDAFTGISINAPNGDISIKGKNISLEAGNNIQLISGKNISPKRVAGPIGKAAGLLVGDYAAHLAMAGARIGGVDTTDICDVSFLRAVYEMAASPVEGTLTIKSNRNVVVTAGRGNVTVPTDLMSHARTYHLEGKKIVSSHFDDDEKGRREKREFCDFKGVASDLREYCTEIETFAEEWVSLYESFTEKKRRFQKRIGSAFYRSEAVKDYRDDSNLRQKLDANEKFPANDDKLFLNIYGKEKQYIQNDEYISVSAEYDEVQKSYEKMAKSYDRDALINRMQEMYSNRPQQSESVKIFSGVWDSFKKEVGGFDIPLMEIKMNPENEGEDAIRLEKPSIEKKKIEHLERRGMMDLEMENMKAWSESFIQIVRRTLALCLIDAILKDENWSGIEFLSIKKSGDVNKSKSGERSLNKDLYLAYKTDDSLWKQLISRIVTGTVDNGGLVLGKAIASALSSSVKIGRYDDNGKFHFDVAKLVNRDGQAGPRAFKGGQIRGNVFISHEPGYFINLNDGEGGWSEAANNTLDVLTYYMSKL